MRWWERFLRRGLSSLGVPPTADEVPVKDEKEKGQRASETNREADIAQQLGAPVAELVREFTAFHNQFQADNQTEQRERREYETGELYWTRIAAVAAIVFSFLSIILSGLTLVVLDKTLGVYRRQTTIMAMQTTITRELNSADVEVAGIVCSDANVPRMTLETTISPRFINVGKSRAFGVKLDYTIGNPNVAAVSPYAEQASKGVIGPTLPMTGRPVSMSFLAKGQQASLDDIISGKIPIVLKGSVEYRDIFGAHRLQFESHYMPNSVCGFVVDKVE